MKSPRWRGRHRQHARRARYPARLASRTYDASPSRLLSVNRRFTVFAWPFIWMIGTSIKLEREVLSNRSSVLPERPIPRNRSPYLDDRLFVPAGGSHRDEAIAIVEEQLRGHIWPSNIDPEFARKQTARGIYQRLLMSIPYERWSDS